MRLPFNEMGKATGEPHMGEGEIKILVSVVLTLRYLLFKRRYSREDTE